MSFSQRSEKEMSFPYSGTVVATGDCAYIEDTQNVEAFLQQLRWHVRAVKNLQAFCRSRLQTQGQEQDQQHQDLRHHQQLIQNELEEAWHVGSKIQRALRQLQRHVSVAETTGERERRQMSFNRLLHQASAMLQQLQDAVDVEQWMLRCQLQVSAPVCGTISSAQDVVPGLGKTSSTSSVPCTPLPQTSRYNKTSLREAEGNGMCTLHPSPVLKCLSTSSRGFTVAGKNSEQVLRDHLASTPNVINEQEKLCSNVPSGNVDGLSADHIIPSTELCRQQTVSG